VLRRTMRVGVLGLMAMLLFGSYAASSASAAVQGPWWMKLEGGKQVKIEPKPHLEIKSENEGNFKLKGKILGTAVILECKKVENKGSIWNGPHTGRDEAVITWNECSIAQAVLCKGFPIEVGLTKVRTELMWKYAGIEKELKETGGLQQKIYDVFAPTEPVEKIEGKEKSKFTTITVPTEFEGIKCALAGVFTVYAVGTVYTGWEDQEKVLHTVQWGTAALVEPQNMDVKLGRLKWAIPNVKKLHVEEAPQIAELEFASNPAELEGTIKVEATNGITEFGAWNEV
jgi:hypothetical protein